MSHEFRTPLTSILGFSDLIHMQATQAGNQELMADINRIRKASHHLLHLINDVLDLGRIEAGRMELHAEYFDLALFVDEVADLVKPLVQKQHNTIHIQAANVPPVVYADRGKIQQILLNLLSNAAKFTSDGTITLAVTHERAAEQDWICFDVTDTGIGIADEHLEKLFQPFSQLSNAATRGSSGLGLALSQSFSKLMGGSISVQSRSGSGSTFAVRLPVLVERQTDEPPALDAGNAKEIMA
jgi:signal transduction histidine kinase